MLRQLVATCERTACARRCGPVLLLIGFATALRHPELVSLQVEGFPLVEKGPYKARTRPTRTQQRGAAIPGAHTV